MFNPYIQGWINYYSHFYGSALCRTLQRIDAYLVRWGRNRSISGFEHGQRGQETGLRGSSVPTHSCLPIGAFCMSTTEHREPKEREAHVRIVGARGGEDSPRATRRILVDKLGLLLHALVTAADVQDRDGGVLLLSALFGQFPFLRKLFADSAYTGPIFQGRRRSGHAEPRDRNRQTLRHHQRLRRRTPALDRRAHHRMA